MPGVSDCLVITIVATSATEAFGLLNVNVDAPVIVVVVAEILVSPLVRVPLKKPDIYTGLLTDAAVPQVIE